MSRVCKVTRGGEVWSSCGEVRRDHLAERCVMSLPYKSQHITVCGFEMWQGCREGAAERQRHRRSRISVCGNLCTPQDSRCDHRTGVHTVTGSRSRLMAFATGGSSCTSNLSRTEDDVAKAQAMRSLREKILRHHHTIYVFSKGRCFTCRRVLAQHAGPVCLI